MRSQNKFLSKTRYFNTARWIERDGPFLVWPAAWVEWDLEPVLGVFVHRWTFGLGHARFQLDWGRWHRRNPKAQIDWRTSGLDGFLSWSKKTFGQAWGRSDIERLFKDRPEWRHLVSIGDARAHYVRLLLARELAAAPEEAMGPSREAAEGLSALEVAMEMDADIQTVGSALADPSRTAGADAAVVPLEPRQKPGSRK